MSLAVSCPRCGGEVRPPSLARSDWHCLGCGSIVPLYVPEHVNAEVVQGAVSRAGRHGVPVWCPWPLPAGWMVTGVAWAGDERSGVSATAVVCSGPTPLGSGPADVMLVAEEPGVGLGTRFAGLPWPDPGPALSGDQGAHASSTKVRVGGHPTPLWSVGNHDDRSVYAGEARGRWLYAVSWPAHAAYLFAEDLSLHDLGDWLPGELVFGAPTGRLRTRS